MNGMLPIQHQAITLTSADLLWNGSLGIHFSEIQLKIQTVSFKNHVFENVCKISFKTTSGNMMFCD